MTAGALLKQARTAAGLTQAELAGRLGVSQPEVARLEARRSNPRIDTLRRAIEATGQRLVTSVAPAGASVDETMIVENLRLPPAERLRRFAAAYRRVSDLATRAQASRGP